MIINIGRRYSVGRVSDRIIPFFLFFLPYATPHPLSHGTLQSLESCCTVRYCWNTKPFKSNQPSATPLCYLYHVPKYCYRRVPDSTYSKMGNDFRTLSIS